MVDSFFASRSNRGRSNLLHLRWLLEYLVLPPSRIERVKVIDTWQLLQPADNMRTGDSSLNVFLAAAPTLHDHLTLPRSLFSNIVDDLLVLRYCLGAELKLSHRYHVVLEECLVDVGLDNHTY